MLCANLKWESTPAIAGAFRPNLTFNYGLRWEYSGPPSDHLNEYSMLQNTNDVFGISGPGNLFHPGSTAGNANAFLR